MAYTPLLKPPAGGTGTTTTFTQGSVVFSGASGVYAQDNANLAWDDTNNQLLVAGGTAALPGYAIAADPNTGVFSPGADQLSITTGGTSRLGIDASGQIGINCSTVAGLILRAQQAGANDVGFELQRLSSTLMGVISYDRASSTWTAMSQYASVHTWVTGPTSTEAARIDSNGNFLIGTTSNPNSVKLNVNGQVAGSNFGDAIGTYNVNLGGAATEGRGVVAGYSGGSYGGIGYNIRHTTSGGSYVAPLTDTVNYLRFDQGFSFFYAPSGVAGRTLIDNTTPTLLLQMRLDASGNLLLGTTSNPYASRMHVAGDMTYTGTTTYALPGAGNDYMFSNNNGLGFKFRVNGQAGVPTVRVRVTQTGIAVGGEDGTAGIGYIRGTNRLAGETNSPGGDVFIVGGASTGSAAGGVITFRVTPAGAAGTAVNSETTRLSITPTGSTFIGNLSQNSGAVTLGANSASSFTTSAGTLTLGGNDGIIFNSPVLEIARFTTAGRLALGTNNPDARLHIAAGTQPNATYALHLDTTFATDDVLPSAAWYYMSAPATTTPQYIRGIHANLIDGGYVGSEGSAAIDVDTGVKGTGVNILTRGSLSGTAPRGNLAISAVASPTTAGHNAGIMGVGRRSTARNYGVVGLAEGTTGSVNFGVYGLSRATSGTPIEVAGAFVSGASDTLEPSFNTTLWVDNTGRTDVYPFRVARNGTTSILVTPTSTSTTDGVYINDGLFWTKPPNTPLNRDYIGQVITRIDNNGRMGCLDLCEPRFVSIVYDEFNRTTAELTVGGALYSATATNGSSSVGTTSNAAGIAIINTGNVATVNDGIAVYGRTDIMRFSGPTAFKTRVQIPTLSNTTTEYCFRIGLRSVAIPSGTDTDGVFFEYNRSLSGDVWRCRSFKNSVNTTSIGTSPASILAGIWYALELIVDAGVAEFYVNGASIATITGASVPTAGDAVNLGMAIFKLNASATNRSAHVDYWCVMEYYPR